MNHFQCFVRVGLITMGLQESHSKDVMILWVIRKEKKNYASRINTSNNINPSQSQHMADPEVGSCGDLNHPYKYTLRLNHDLVSQVEMFMLSSFPSCVSLHVPDLTEQRGKFVVVHSPGCEHLCVVVAERPQLRQASQETSEVLRILRMLQDTHLPQHVQNGLLKSLDGLLILHVRPIWWRHISLLEYLG